MVTMAAYSVQIGALYDGPLDLLLDLIRKQSIDIYDIPIARITAQYLEILKNMTELDVEGAADFLLMAATLIQIKSKMLLPADPTLPGEPAAEDPRQELVRRLLEYEKFKQAAALLHQKQQLEEASWPQPGLRDFREDQAAEPELAVGVYDVARAFQAVLQRLRERPRLAIDQPDVTVAQMLERLRTWLARDAAPLSLQAIFGSAASPRALVVTFLAVLELVRLGEVRLRQERVFGEIFIKPAPVRARRPEDSE